MDYLDEIKNNFKYLIERKVLSHAYLFFGGNERDRDSIYSFAMSLAHFLERDDFAVTGQPLVEVQVIEKKGETIGIDAMRDMRYFLYQQPVFASRRTVVVRDAEALTPEAQNAILKIAEEPPAQALMLLIARNEENLYGTLRSRLQRIYFRAVPQEEGEGKRYAAAPSLFDEAAYEDMLDVSLEAALLTLMKDPLANWKQMKVLLHRLTLMKQFTTNKKLQVRAMRQHLR